MRTGIAAIAALGAVALTGCSGGQQAPSMEAGQASSQPPKGGPVMGKIGDTYHGGKVDVTVEDFNPRVTSQYTSKTWQAAMVKTCPKEAGLQVGLTAWSVADEKGGRWTLAQEEYQDAPKPKYPIQSDQLAQGECVRGWAMFDASPDAKAVELRYSPDGEAGARWKIA